MATVSTLTRVAFLDPNKSNGSMVGYCAVFSSKNNPDFDGQWFDYDTVFGNVPPSDGQVIPVLYDWSDGYDGSDLEEVGVVAKIERGLFGIFCEIEIKSALDPLAKLMLGGLVIEEVLHMVLLGEKDMVTIGDDGHIKSWEIEAVLLTVAPSYVQP